MPLISRAHTQEVRPGRAHPSPDLPGGEHKKPPFLARGASRPGRLSRGGTHLAAEMEAPPDRSGRRPQEGPRGGRRGDRSTPVPRRRRWWPWPSWGLSSIRYGRGGLGRAGSRQSGPRTPRLPPATAPAGWAPLCHLTVLPTARRTLGPSAKGAPGAWPGPDSHPASSPHPGQPGSGREPWKEEPRAMGPPVRPKHPKGGPSRWASTPWGTGTPKPNLLAG